MQVISKESLCKLFDASKPLIINADVLNASRKLPSSLIDVIVTSPPYWNQRNYNHQNELGKEETSEQYVEKIADVGLELKRVLKDTGVFFLNIGDKYNEKDLEIIPERVALKMKENGWIIRNKIIWRKTNPNPCPVMDRFTNAYEIIFMFVKNTNNYFRSEYYFDLDAVRVPHKTKQNVSKNGHLPKTISVEDFAKYSNKIKIIEYNGKYRGQDRKNIGASAGGRVNTNGEYYSLQRKHPITQDLKIEIIKFLRNERERRGVSIDSIDAELNKKHTAGHWFRLDKGGSSLPDYKQWETVKKILGLKTTKYDNIVTEMHYVLQTVRWHEKGKNPSDVWDMSTSCIKEKHFAPFPDKLPEMCIKSCCPDKGIVLDPFCGSGTTLKIAKQLKRKSIGIEINASYNKIIKRVVGEISPPPKDVIRSAILGFLEYIIRYRFLSFTIWNV